MFARQVDPFLQYNAALSAAEKRHRELTEQEFEQEIPMNTSQPPRNKRPLHFEPESTAALDSSLVEKPTLSRPRPCKKSRTTASSKSIPSKEAQEPNSAATVSNATGPSIIDLASGEELVAFHLGENEHKRRRDSTFEPSIECDLREVYDVQEDGSLHPIMDHAPALPSPTKKLRLGKSDNHLQCLRENMKKPRSKQPEFSTNTFQNAGSSWYRESNGDTAMDQDGWISEEEEDEVSRTQAQLCSKADLKALIRYEGPKTATLADGFGALIKERWSSHQPDLLLEGIQGYELVLYQRPLPAAGCQSGSLGQEESSTRIEELDDDEVDRLSGESLQDDPLLVRSSAGIGLSEGAPAFGAPAGFEKQAGNIRVLQYSKNGLYLAWATPEGVKVMDAQSLQMVQEFAIKDVIEIDFSPKGTYISTWVRQIKTEDGSHKNMSIYDVKTGQELTAFSQKNQNNWNVQWTDDETYCARMVSNEVHFWEPKNLSKPPFTKLRLEGMSQFSLSPGKSTSVAVFFGERKGAPAIVRIYSITNFSVPLASKSFFKADRVQMIWNQLGTNILVWATTDVDKTGKSYYGETNLYYLAVAGNFDCRVPIDGLIHDVAWAPASKDFVVIHGQMPSPKTTLFDHRANAVHEFGRDARNAIKWNPQGRVLVLAGFGNLAGTMDFWDRKTLKKIASVSAHDTTACEWSPDGRHILTATLSPRLRVDNGYKIWHYTGTLVHVEEMNELYQVSWRPCAPEIYPIRSSLSPAPKPAANASAAQVKAAPVKSMGAYRPPQARGTPAPSLFTDASAAAAAAAADANLSKAALKNKKKRENAKKNKEGEDVPASGSGNNSPAGTPARSNTPRPNSTSTRNGGSPVIGSSNNSNKGKNSNGGLLPAATTSSSGQMTETEKKIRNVTKKLKQIHELKEKQAAGETLELTQIQKITAEAALLKELEALKI
ncbi:hypothetical protein BG005_009095 [Podila minutissima]|nr:hypothetical protein BG005_009095 [Podila minutissima]